MRLLNLICGLTLLLNSVTSFAAQTPEANVIKDLSNKWTLTYTFKSPVTQIAFVRNPDNSRVSRWLPLAESFEVIYEDEQEYIRHRNGIAFKQVSLQLTPTYKHLTKDYAPFSPYSDGGILIYSGRLFACAEMCEGDENNWPLKFKVPADEHIVADGKIYNGYAEFIDSNDGQNVYIGQQTPLETASFITVIDSNLPNSLQETLGQQLPRMMDFFEDKLGKYSGGKPMLFASYANVPGQSSQGGTLPNQVFMHWNRNDLAKLAVNDTFARDTLWFFAHEAAHFFQHGNVHGELYSEASESWLHEGHAEYLAAVVLRALYPTTQNYVTARLERYINRCAEGLENTTLSAAASNNQFGLYYTCGALIHQSLDQAIQFKTLGAKTIFSLWMDYRNAVVNGEKAGGETFWSVAETDISAQKIEALKAMISTPLSAPEKFIKDHL